jgi:hypothetical protein
MITDGSGSLIWFHRLPAGQGVSDFRTRPTAGGGC